MARFLLTCCDVLYIILPICINFRPVAMLEEDALEAPPAAAIAAAVAEAAESATKPRSRKPRNKWSKEVGTLCVSTEREN